MLPARDKLHVVFAHGAYQMADRFAARRTGIAHSQVRNLDDLRMHVGEADVVCVSMMWKNDLLAAAPRLQFIQSISAGIDQYDVAAFKSRGVRLASAAGVNANAVAEHAFALTLALQRHIHTGRDNQMQSHWRPMILTIAAREAELTGKTMVIVGLGRIGGRLARFAKAFDMRVIGVKRNITEPVADVDQIVMTRDLLSVLPHADIVVLGPGSLFTSVMPNLLVSGITQALRETSAPVIYVGNVATERGETDHFTLDDHVNALERHIGQGIVDVVIANNHMTDFKPPAGVEIVQPVQTLAKSNALLLQAEVVDDKTPWRHDPVKLAGVVMKQVRR